MPFPLEPHWIAFTQATCLASGPFREVSTHIKQFLDQHPAAPVSIFDASTSQPIELDLRGSLSDVLTRLSVYSFVSEQASLENLAHKGPGRPKLGVVAKEVTLLPWHWEWLASQPGGISVALRKLIEQAQKINYHSDHIRMVRESAYRFMNSMAGNEPGFEEATRALFAGDHERFKMLIQHWPNDIRNHILSLTAAELSEK